MKRKIIYYFACGCILPQEKAPVITAAKNNNKRLCPKHDADVLIREVFCVLCGQSIFAKKKGAMNKYCDGDDCQEIVKLQDSERIQNRVPKKPVVSKQPTAYQKFLVDPIGGWCQSIDVCQAKGPLKCSICREMMPIFSGVNPGRKSIYQNCGLRLLDVTKRYHARGRQYEKESVV